MTEKALFRITLLKTGAFFAVCVVGFMFIVGTLRSNVGGVSHTYHADFSDVSGLLTGDPVRVAGVEVGKVDGVDLLDATHIRVTFTANDDQPLTVTTYAEIRYANLIGQRYLALTDADRGSEVLPPGGTIPVSRTSPAVSLTTLLNGFRPLFQQMNPDQINQLAGDIVGVLQGESGRIDDVLAQAASLATDSAQRAALIGQAVTSLRSVVSVVAQHDQQLGLVMDQLNVLTGFLAKDSGSINNALISTSTTVASLDHVTAGARNEGLAGLFANLDQVGETLVNNSSRLHETFGAFLQTFAALNRITQSGSFVSGFPCLGFVATAGTPQISITDLAQAVEIFLGTPTNPLQPIIGLLGGLPAAKIPVQIPQGQAGPSKVTKVCQ